MGHAQAIRVDRERASSRAVPIRAVMARRSDVRLDQDDRYVVRGRSAFA